MKEFRVWFKQSDSATGPENKRVLNQLSWLCVARGRKELCRKRKRCHTELGFTIHSHGHVLPQAVEASRV